MSSDLGAEGYFSFNSSALDGEEVTTGDLADIIGEHLINPDIQIIDRDTVLAFWNSLTYSKSRDEAVTGEFSFKFRTIRHRVVAEVAPKPDASAYLFAPRPSQRARRGQRDHQRAAPSDLRTPARQPHTHGGVLVGFVRDPNHTRTSVHGERAAKALAQSALPQA